MKGSTRFGTISGIDLKVHWTFWLMLIGLFAWYLYMGASVAAALTGLGLVVSVFGCVVLHELGHAMAARRYGIPTLDITLYPIGGIARLKRIPHRPSEELVIALAGPAVNLVIAAVLFGISSVDLGSGSLRGALSADLGFVGMLAWLNLALAAFNMIPAFPMDGGRVLRAGLATSVDYRTATHIAAVVAHGVAVIFFVYGIVSLNVTLPFIAVFVVLAARQELAYVRDRT